MATGASPDGGLTSSSTRRSGEQVEQRFAAFFEANWAQAHRLAVMVGAEDPEDVAQEAFSRIHGRFTQVDRDGNARAYLNRSICNIATSRWRRAQTGRRFRHLLAPDSAARSGPENATAESSAIAAALTTLSQRQRQVLVLRFWMDLPEREISQILDITPGSVKTHAHRGLQQLRASMKGTQ